MSRTASPLIIRVVGPNGSDIARFAELSPVVIQLAVSCSGSIVLPDVPAPLSVKSDDTVESFSERVHTIRTAFAVVAAVKGPRRRRSDAGVARGPRSAPSSSSSSSSSGKMVRRRPAAAS